MRCFLADSQVVGVGEILVEASVIERPFELDNILEISEPQRGPAPNDGIDDGRERLDKKRLLPRQSAGELFPICVLIFSEVCNCGPLLPSMTS